MQDLRRELRKLRRGGARPQGQIVHYYRFPLRLTRTKRFCFL
jgi:hypothetical protein